MWEYWGLDAALETKIGQINSCHIFMSYASNDIKCHIMTNDAYVIEIWCKSIWSILVSKEAAGPHKSHQLIRFGQTNCFKIKIKVCRNLFTFINLNFIFVFLGPKRWSWRQQADALYTDYCTVVGMNLFIAPTFMRYYGL